MAEKNKKSGREKMVKSIQEALKIKQAGDMAIKKADDFIKLRKAPEMDRPRDGLPGEGRAFSYPIRERGVMTDSDVNDQPLNPDTSAFNAQLDADRQAKLEALQQMGTRSQMSPEQMEMIRKRNPMPRF